MNLTTQMGDNSETVEQILSNKVVLPPMDVDDVDEVSRLTSSEVISWIERRASAACWHAVAKFSAMLVSKCVAARNELYSRILFWLVVGNIFKSWSEYL